MIRSITVTNHLGESLTLELRSPEKSGFLVKSVDGLGPVSANVSISEFASIDGGVYTSSRLSTRNIVINLILLPKPTIEDTRQLSYKYFPLKKQIKITVVTDNRNVSIYGYVESNNPNIFSKQESIQVSIICPDPYFVDNNTTNTVFLSKIEPTFEFPFSESFNEFTVENKQIRANVYNGGVQDVGVIFKLKGKWVEEIGNQDFEESGSEQCCTGIITIANLTTKTAMKINADVLSYIRKDANPARSSGLLNGETLIIDTRRGSKSVKLVTSDSTEYNAMNAVSLSSKWIELATGENIITYNVDVGINNTAMEIEFSSKYEGV